MPISSRFELRFLKQIILFDGVKFSFAQRAIPKLSFALYGYFQVFQK